MQIAICDDEAIFRTELRTFISDYKRTRRLQIDIYEFDKGENLLASDLIFDMVFMDYQMPSLDGMETARALRTKNSLCSIVFITNYPGFVFESFEVNPYRFFKKPITALEIQNLFDIYIRQQKALAPILINDFWGQKTIASKDIIYLEADGKYCIIRTVNETAHSSKTLAGVLSLLPQYCFYRIHRTYAINMYYVFRIENNQVTFINGEKAIIGRNHLADFKKTYRDFIKNYCLKI